MSEYFNILTHVEAHLQFTTSAQEIKAPLPVLVHAVSGDLEQDRADVKALLCCHQRFINQGSCVKPMS